MFIIFDLDDTLIDTSGCITPIKLEEALRHMIAYGLAINDFTSSLELLKKLNAESESAKDAIAKFLDLLGAGKDFFKIAMEKMQENFSSPISIATHPGVVSLLQELYPHHLLAIVTVGSPPLQMEKLKKAGIDTQLFSKIVISEKQDKGPHYQALLKEFSRVPLETLVCGDRASIDLTPAKRLGCRTVHLRKGRGRRSVADPRDIDYTIDELPELKEILSIIRG